MLFEGLYKSLFENPVLVTNAFLKAIKVKVSLNTIDQTLHEHPDYPSFLSVTDSLKKWNVDCLALQINVEKLLSIPVPFITSYKNGQFIIVNQFLGDEINVIDQHGKKESITMNLFLEKWNESIIVAEANDQSGEKDYNKKQGSAILNTAAFAFIPLGILIYLLFPFINGTVGIFTTLYLISKFVGLSASLMLLWYDIDKGNPLLKQICSGIQKANCSAVLNTKAATIAGIITWSEVGFIYFASSLLFSAIAGINSVIPLLNLFSLLALPYIVFSIYYQWRIAKQWCLLCLGVQSVLLLEGILTVINNTISYTVIEQVVTESWSTAFIALIIPTLTWFLIKPILKRNQAAKYEKRSYLQLKFNELVFNSLLHNQQSILAYPTDGLGITIGNPNATKTIVKICNPYCEPCAKSHISLEELIKNNNKINLQIIFNSSNDELDKTSIPVKHFLAIAAKSDEYLIENALDDWYLSEDKNYDYFAKKYPLFCDFVDESIKIDEMKKWCENVNIHYTPTIFIDGYKLPKYYHVKDLNYFLT